MQQRRPENGAMTFDEVSMERSKSFVMAMQELKNLRPQLYSAAEYCEKSYLRSEQKQMVLDNLKSYAVRAIVNAVDHLGTVAYKLTDLFEQQLLDASTMEMKISCLNQQNFTCQAYGDKDGLSQHQTPARTLRHHKHYILPSQYASNMLSWHVASEANSAANGDPLAAPCTRGVKCYKVNSEVFHLLVAEDPAASLPLSAPLRATSGNVTFDMIPNKSALMGSLKSPKPISAIKSFDSPGRREICRPPGRSKSMLSAFFNKNKTFKTRKVLVS
ncbi:protein ABIL1-like [Musa acuminata AAA Group]|uniref:protein ABIL1 n=1 Tax=Musa acuminata AAA Group TaxID=214697 RepID=UPI0031E497ED